MPSDFELTLTLHELFALPAGTPATGPAFRIEINPDDQSTFFALARQVKFFTKEDGVSYYRVFVHDERRPQGTIFCMAGARLGRKEPRSEEEVKEFTAKYLAKRSITRFWKSPEFPYCVTLSSAGTGSVIPQSYLSPFQDNFRVQSWDKELFWEWDSDEFHSFCQQMVLDSESELNVFLRWQKLSSEEKTALATTCETGDWEQLKHLFTWVLQLVVYHFGPYPSVYGSGKSSFWHFTREIPVSYDRPAVFFARRWQDAIFGIIRPNFWKPPPGLYWPALDNLIVCDTPTAHEYLEAQLRLREFLRPHIATDEIEALFIPSD